MARPNTSEYFSFYSHYVSLAKGNSVKELIDYHSKAIINFYNAIPSEKGTFAYAEGKWTIQQLLQHVIDTERIFSYRLVCIARGEKQSLPGFDENSYAEQAPATHRSLEVMQQELTWLRQSTDALILSLTDAELQNTGTASNHPISANALCFIIYGHLLHHMNIIRERYLTN